EGGVVAVAGEAVDLLGGDAGVGAVVEDGVKRQAVGAELGEGAPLAVGGGADAGDAGGVSGKRSHAAVFLQHGSPTSVATRTGGRPGTPRRTWAAARHIPSLRGLTVGGGISGGRLKSGGTPMALIAQRVSRVSRAGRRCPAGTRGSRRCARR